MHMVLVLTVVLCVAVYYGNSQFLEGRYDPREPPPLPQKFPFIGHVIGMLRKKGRYYIELR